MKPALLCLLILPASATTYYLDADGGNDGNSGTSEAAAWKTLAHASSRTFQPGDSILLQRGDAFTGKLLLDNESGTAVSPIVIGSYGSGNKPLINASGYIAGVHLRNVSYIEVSDLEITGNGGAMVDGSPAGERFGVLMDATPGGAISHLTVQNLFIHDIYPSVGTNSEGANPTTHMGFGVVARGQSSPVSEHIVVQDCTIDRMGFKAINFSRVNFIDILDNSMTDIGGPAIQPGRCNDVVVRGNTVVRSGSYADPRMHGRGSGIWPWTCERVLIEKNSFSGARGRGDSCGIHIDYNCSQVVVQYNLSVDNGGGFMEILGNAYNNAYRYNISINDGGRVRGVIDQGTLPNDQDGNILFISGYTGSGANTGPFNSYLYNNTIYVKSSIKSAFHIQENARRLLIANNIFYIEGSTSDKTSGSLNNYTQAMADSVVWENNLYQRAGIIPSSFPFAETGQSIGDPIFANPGGQTAEDYIPSSFALVTDQGMEIQKLPGDPLGLEVGLQVTEDFFGNPIVGTPDMGAVEIRELMPTAAFTKAPSAASSNSVTMTSVQGPTGTEYYFAENSGNFGGSDSGWQASRTYTDTGLLPNTSYRYTVRLRDSQAQEGSPSPSSPATTPRVQPFVNPLLFSEDFSNVGNPNNQTSPFPAQAWYTLDEDPASNTSVSATTGRLRTGWGYDTVTTLYRTGHAWDLSRSYRLRGDWIIDSVLDKHLGISIGIGEFNPTTGALVRRVKGITVGNLVNPVIAEGASFVLQLSQAEIASAGVSAGNRMGLFIDHPGANTPNRNDVYLVDNLVLEWISANADSDGDGIPDGDETDMGLNPDNPEDGSDDDDGDGFTNSQEFLIGTDLSDANSRLTVFDEINNNQLEIGLSQSMAKSGRWYIFEQSTDLSGWTATQAESGADVTGDLIFAMPANDGKGFGRIRVEWK